MGIITSIYQKIKSCLYKLTSAKYNSMARPNNEVAVPELLKYPAFFEMTGDTINKVYLVEGDSIFATNIKKGIMALFQIKEEAGERTEVGTSQSLVAFVSLTFCPIEKFCLKQLICHVLHTGQVEIVYSD